MNFFSFVRKNKNFKLILISSVLLWFVYILIWINMKNTELYNNLFLAISYLILVSLVFLEGVLLIYKKMSTISFLSEKLDYQNDYDVSSGLLNQRRLYSDVTMLIENNVNFYFAFGTINNAKYLNNKFGFLVGRNLITESAAQVQLQLCKKTSFYHYGGDEFVLVIKSKKKNEVRTILKKVMNVYGKDININNVKASISINFGVVEYPANGKTVDELIRNASFVLNDKKFSNKNTFSFYQDSAFTENLTSYDYDIYVSKLDLNFFEVHLMPIVSTETNLIEGFECLTRPYDKAGKSLHTEHIINSLERNGKIQELDEIVFNKTLAIMKRLNATFDHEIFLSVNASAISLNKTYVKNVISAFKRANLKKGTIVVELTESSKVNDEEEMIALLNELVSAGIKIGIDDFGTGYSSLSYISKFPIYVIKMDQEFVGNFKGNDFNITLIRTINSIANSLSCKLVSEGVENQETLDFLRENNCNYFQGYFFSKALPLPDAIELISSNQLEFNTIELCSDIK